MACLRRRARYSSWSDRASRTRRAADRPRGPISSQTPSGSTLPSPSRRSRPGSTVARRSPRDRMRRRRSASQTWQRVSSSRRRSRWSARERGITSARADRSQAGGSCLPNRQGRQCRMNRHPCASPEIAQPSRASRRRLSPIASGAGALVLECGQREITARTSANRTILPLPVSHRARPSPSATIASVNAIIGGDGRQRFAELEAALERATASCARRESTRQSPVTAVTRPTSGCLDQQLGPRAERGLEQRQRLLAAARQPKRPWPGSLDPAWSGVVGPSTSSWQPTPVAAP